MIEFKLKRWLIEEIERFKKTEYSSLRSWSMMMIMNLYYMKSFNMMMDSFIVYLAPCENVNDISCTMFCITLAVVVVVLLLKWNRVSISQLQFQYWMKYTTSFHLHSFTIN